jgi:hypothetical protein
MNSKRKILDNETRAMVDKKFPLPPSQEDFETKRTLVGLFKQGPLETNKEFALRVWKATREYQANKQKRSQANLPTPDEQNSA